MEKKQISLREKGKRIGLTLGVALLVYYSFRYLLSPALPFLLAWIGAGLMRPWIQKISKRVPFLKESLAAGLLMAAAAAVFFLGAVLLGQELWQQACRILKWLPGYLEQFYGWFAEGCSGLERQLSMEPGTILEVAEELYEKAEGQLQDGSVSYFMNHSRPVLLWLGSFFTGLAVMVMAVVLTIKDWETLKRGLRRSYFWEDISAVVERLKGVGKVYVKSQGIIMALTAVICSAGLFLLRNPYAVLLGVLIGLLDALPLFGTGTVFVPWILVCVLNRSYGQAAGLLAIYVVCYFVREFLEARLMGKGIGITSLETLISIYAGFYLFGILGFLLGPAGYLITKELTSQWLTNEPVSYKMEARKDDDDEE